MDNFVISLFNDDILICLIYKFYIYQYIFGDYSLYKMSSPYQI